MASTKKVVEFNLNLNIPQVRSLEGKELMEEQEKFNKHFYNKVFVTYTTVPTVEQIFKDLEEVDEVRIATRGLQIRVEKNYNLWINGNLYGPKASSTKDEQARAEEVWTYVEKTGNWIRPTTVRFTGKQWLQNKLEQLLK